MRMWLLQIMARWCEQDSTCEVNRRSLAFYARFSQNRLCYATSVPCCCRVKVTNVTRKFLRAFLLGLLIIAVPFQGYAAAAMLCCESAYSKDAGHSLRGMAPHDDIGTVPTTVHDHDDGAATIEHRSSAAGEHGAAGHHHPAGPSKRFVTKCSACAGCCVGAALVQTTDTSLAVGSSDSARIAFHPRHFYHFVPDTLVRPPYRLFAWSRTQIAA